MECSIEVFLYLPLRLIFLQLHPNFINVRSAYASKICVQLTKNFLAKTSTKILRYYIQQELDKAARLEYSLKVDSVEMILESWREFD